MIKNFIKVSCLMLGLMVVQLEISIYVFLFLYKGVIKTILITSQHLCVIFQGLTTLKKDKDYLQVNFKSFTFCPGIMQGQLFGVNSQFFAKNQVPRKKKNSSSGKPFHLHVFLFSCFLSLFKYFLFVFLFWIKSYVNRLQQNIPNY